MKQKPNKQRKYAKDNDGPLGSFGIDSALDSEAATILICFWILDMVLSTDQVTPNIHRIEYSIYIYSDP